MQDRSVLLDKYKGDHTFNNSEEDPPKKNSRSRKFKIYVILILENKTIQEVVISKFFKTSKNSRLKIVARGRQDKTRLFSQKS